MHIPFHLHLASQVPTLRVHQHQPTRAHAHVCLVQKHYMRAIATLVYACTSTPLHVYLFHVQESPDAASVLVQQWVVGDSFGELSLMYNLPRQATT